MPSPSVTQFEIASPSQPDRELSQNGSKDMADVLASNGAQYFGVTSPAQAGDLILEGKQKAKAVMAAASGLPVQSEQRVETIANSPEVPAVKEPLFNGNAQSRKRSRSGTRLDRPSNPEEGSAEAACKNRLLHQYVDREMVHTAAVIYDRKEYEALMKEKLGLKSQYMHRRQLRGQHSEHTFAEDSGSGHGRVRVGTHILYPKQKLLRKGKKTPDLRIPKADLLTQSEQIDELVPVRLDIEWDKIRLRDTFTWNLHDRVVTPELFAKQLVDDFKLDSEVTVPLVQQVCSSLKEQIQDFYPQIFIDEAALDPKLPYNAYKDDEMRIIIKLNITIGQHTLVDQFEWEINNPLNSPEEFAVQMTRDLSLSGEFTTAIAHSIREQSQLFTRSLYVTGHPFDGRPVEDQELKAGFLPSPMLSPFRPYQAAKEFTPYLYDLSEVDLEKTELSLSREERRQKRSVNRRGGPALPDLKDRRRTIRTLVVSSVLPGAAGTMEDSRIYKRAATASGRGRRPGQGQKDGIDDSDESESDDSVAESPAVPAHLLAGTARTRGMRGAATVAQQAMRGTLGRSATPEPSTLHHHETRTSGRRFGGKDYREDSVDESPTFIIKLRIPRDRFKQYLREQKPKSNHHPSSSQPHLSHRRSQSGTPGTGTPAAGAMGPPSSTPAPTQQSNARTQASSSGHQREGQPSGPIVSIHPHAAQIGRVDAVGPPSQENPIVSFLALNSFSSISRSYLTSHAKFRRHLQPLPPSWLNTALGRLKVNYPNDDFEGTMRYTAVSTVTDLPISVRPDAPPPENVKYMYYPRIKCKDCPGKLYTPGPEMGVNNFEVHLKNRIHREKVEKRVAIANAANGAASTSGE